MSSKPRLTISLRKQILSSIRSGGYPYVAAKAWGVSREVFDSWLARGQGDSPREPYASFAREVMEAQGQARLRAEIEVFQKDPRNWLEHGPGRETVENPGWSTSVKAAETSVEARNPWLDPELMRVFQVILTELQPVPEIRLRVSRLIQTPPSTPKRRAA